MQPVNVLLLRGTPSPKRTGGRSYIQHRHAERLSLTRIDGGSCQRGSRPGVRAACPTAAEAGVRLSSCSSHRWRPPPIRSLCTTQPGLSGWFVACAGIGVLLSLVGINAGLAWVIIGVAVAIGCVWIATGTTRVDFSGTTDSCSPAAVPPGPGSRQPGGAERRPTWTGPRCDCR
jgi:hypothetical protein